MDVCVSKQDEAIVFLGRILASAQPAFHEVYLMGLDDEALYQNRPRSGYFRGRIDDSWTLLPRFSR